MTCQACFASDSNGNENRDMPQFVLSTLHSLVSVASHEVPRDFLFFFFFFDLALRLFLVFVSTFVVNLCSVETP